MHQDDRVSFSFILLMWHIIGLAKEFAWLMNMLFNKVLGENEKCFFYFYLNLNELSGQPNTLIFVCYTLLTIQE